jgi:hypothetical protein
VEILDIDSSRFVLVVALCAAWLFYSKYHLVAGGTTTGAFLAIVLHNQQWILALWIPACAMLIYLVFKFVVLPRVALPKAWIFSMMVLNGVLFSGIFEILYLQDVLARDSLLFAIVMYGSYITPGLLAYDLAHQDIKRTFLALGAVSAGTLLITTPLLLLMSEFDVGISGTELSRALYFDARYLWVETFACVILGFILRFGMNLRSGGFIGPVFILQFVTLESVATVALSAISAWAITTVLVRFAPLTPRQKANVALISGALIAWFGLYWASFFGWLPAIEANGFATAPLLAVGLIAADMTRSQSNPVTTLLGTLLNTAGIFVVTYFVSNNQAITGIGLLLGFLGLALYRLVPKLKSDWDAARLAGASSGLRLQSPS